MPPFLAGLAASLGANALKIAAMALAAAALVGGGYVWGDTHATRLAMEASANAAQVQIAAVAAGYQASLNDYATRLKAQAARGDQLAAELDLSRTQLAAAAAAAKEKLSHVMPANSICDLPAAAVDVLRAQPARH